MSKRTISKFSLAIALVVVGNAAFAAACPTSKAKARAVYGNTGKEACANLSASGSIQNPYMYTNPDAKCDFGLSLPGLPNFGSGGGGLSACSIVKAITGPMVREVNQGMQEATNEAIDAVGKEKLDMAVNAGNSKSMAEFGSKQYEEMGAPSAEAIINNPSIINDKAKGMVDQ